MSLYRSGYLCLALLAAAGCGGADDFSSSGGSRIINGIEADLAASPQMVEVISIKDGADAARCTGTVIAADAVLTAGHCVGFGEEQVLVRTVSGTLPAELVLRHPGYREEPSLSAIFNDVAVLRTAPHGLPGLAIIAGRPASAGEMLAVYGFGLDSEGRAGVLRSAQIEVALVTDNHIFSAPFHSDGANPCLGDSGGPAVLAFQDENGALETGLAGIVSTGTIQGCAEGDTTLFTNLQNPAVLEFIAAAAPGAALR